MIFSSLSSVSGNENLDEPVHQHCRQEDSHIEYAGGRIKYQARHDQHQRGPGTPRNPGDAERQQKCIGERIERHYA